MSDDKPPAWRENADAVRLETFKDALTAANGNITEAAELVHVHRSHAMRLMKRFGLTEYATELRLKSGRGRRGRPSAG